MDELPASRTQKRLWLANDRGGPGAAHPLAMVVELAGPLADAAIAGALNAAFARHEIMRTSLVYRGGTLVQVIGESLVIIGEPRHSGPGGGLTRYDRPAPPWLPRQALTRHHIDRLLAELAPARMAFEVQRIRLSDGSPVDHQLLIVWIPPTHADQRSVRRLFDDFCRALDPAAPAGLAANGEGQDRQLEDGEVLGFADYSEWHASLPSHVVAKEEQYWRDQQVPAPTFDRLRAAAAAVAHTNPGPFEVPPGLAAALRERAGSLVLSLETVLLAAWGILLLRLGHSGGVAVEAAAHPGGSAIVGPVSDWVPLHLSIRPDDGVPLLMRNVHAALRSARDHAVLGYEAIAPLLGWPDDPACRFSYAPEPGRTHLAAGVAVTHWPAYIGSDPLLGLHLATRDDGALGGYLHGGEAIGQSLRAALAEGYLDLLRQLADGAAAHRIGDLKRRVADAGRPAVWSSGGPGGDAPECPHPSPACLHQLFERQAALRPDAVAVIDGGRAISFAGLNRGANQLARFLEAAGVPEGPIAVCAEPGAGMQMSLLAVMKLGRPYVPIDPALPRDRIEQIVAGCGAATMLVSGAERPSGAAAAQLVSIQDIAGQLRRYPVENLDRPVIDRDLAYVIFTSGSTGVPKGCALEHRGIVNRIDWMWRHYGFTTVDVVLQKTPFVFDVSVWELFLPLCFGATTVICPAARRGDPAALLALVQRTGVTAVHFVPSMLNAFLDHLEARGLAGCASLRCVFASGEALQRETNERWYARSSAALHNLYGPTEASIDVSYHACQPADLEIPIGRPVALCRLGVLGPDLDAVLPGTIGELHIGGPCLARGYFGNPGLTAGAFVPDPSGVGERLYRTGDLAVRRDDGAFLFLGRRDSQVKIRGHRVELGEIESVLSSHPLIENAAVLAEEGGLTAYLASGAAMPELVKRLIDARAALTRSGGGRLETLPNGLVVAGHAAGETAFSFAEVFEQRIYLAGGVALWPGAFVVDVGANIGMFSLQAALAGARVAAFEPAEPIRRYLEINAGLYHPLPITVFPFALADRRGHAEFTFYRGNSLLSGLHADAARDDAVVAGYMSGQGGAELWPADADRLRPVIGTCELRRLSDLIDEHGWAAIDLLKIDAERSEWQVLRGIEDRHWPRIGQVVLEVHGREAAAEIDALLRSRGFTVSLAEPPHLAAVDLFQLSAVRPEQRPATAPPGFPDGISPAARYQDVRRSIIDHCRSKLPAHAVPTAFRLIARMPFSPTGKLDRSRLKTEEAAGGLVMRGGTLPRDPTEERVAACWRAVLGHAETGQAEIGVDESFFEVGGHSLRAVRLAFELENVFGQRLSVQDLRRSPTIAEQAIQLRGHPTSRRVAEPIPRRESRLLSFAQERIWTLCRLFPGADDAYRIGGVFELRGPLDVTALFAALTALADRHEVLRSRIVTLDGAPRPRIAAAAEQRFTVRETPPDGNSPSADELLAEAAAAIRLDGGPLWNVCLARTAEQTHLLAVQLHHVIADGWSLKILMRDLAALYLECSAGVPAELPPLPVRYTDYAAWQRDWVTRPDGVAHGEFWDAQLRGHQRPRLPYDAPRAPLRSFTGESVSLLLNADRLAALTALASRQDASLFAALLALCQLLLSRYTARDDTLIGVVVAGRINAELQDQVGLFVNTLPVRRQLDQHATLPGLVTLAGQALRAAQDHEAYPFDHIVTAARERRDLSRPPLLDVLVTSQDRDFQAVPAIGGLAVRRLETRRAGSKSDLALHFVPRDDGIELVLEYDAALFHRSTIERMGRHFVRLTDAATTHSGPVASLCMADETEFPVADRGGEDPPPPDCLAEFVARARETPDRVALSGASGQVTYGWLARRADAIARYLAECHRPAIGKVFGILLDKSPCQVAATLGVPRAGGTFLWLDPANPLPRLRDIIRTAGVAAVLTTGDRDHRALGVPSIDVNGPAIAARTADQPVPLVPPDPGDIAYAIFTSGSTGTPKGTTIPRSGLNNLVAWHLDAFALESDDVCLHYSAPGFDAAIWELFPGLARGCRIHLMSGPERLDIDRLGATLTAHGISHCFLPPQIAGLIPARRTGALKYLLTGGDVLSRLPDVDCTVVNNYGVSEVSVVSSSTVVPDREGGLSIGGPIRGTSLCVLDRYLNPNPVGIIGELHVGGAGLGTGYIGQPAATAAAFVPNPFGLGTRLYRTGDLAAWTSGGMLHYHGRDDRQLKVRGNRVERGEVEHVLLSHPDVHAAVVVPVGGDTGETDLVAHVVVAGAATARAGWLRDHLAGILPNYMVPARFVFHDALPLTAHGKVDHAALASVTAPPPDDAAATEADWSATETVIAGLWQTAAGWRPASRRDNFFQGGANSLQAIKLRTLLAQTFQLDLSIQEFFTAPTVEAFAAVAEARRDSAAAPPAMVSASRTHPLTATQQQMWLTTMSGADPSVYNLAGVFQVTGPLDAARLRDAMARVVQRHAALRTRILVNDGRPYCHVASPDQAAIAFHDHGGDVPPDDGEDVPPDDRDNVPPDDGDDVPPDDRDNVPPVDGDNVPPDDGDNVPSDDGDDVPPDDRDNVSAFIRNATSRRFDLKSGPPCRVEVLRTGEARHLIVLCAHHALCDGISMAIVARELLRFYASPTAAEIAPAGQFADFVRWQLDFLDSPAGRDELAWWRDELSTLPAGFAIPADRDRRDVHDFAGVTESVELDDGLVARLAACAAALGATRFQFLFACLAAQFARYTRQPVFVAGVVAAGRDMAEYANAVGPFAHLLPLAVRVDVLEPFSTLLARVQAKAGAVFAHGHVPLDRIPRDTSRSTGHAPFELCFSYVDQSLVAANPAPAVGIAIESDRLERAVALYDLSLIAVERGSAMQLLFEYAPARFDPETIELIAAHFLAVVRQAVANPVVVLADLAL